jgi:hypothetical protein
MSSDAPVELDLFHYTSPSGLIGILNEKAIRATDCRFVSDEMEVAHGLAVAMRLFQERKEAGAQSSTSSVLEKTSMTSRPISPVFPRKVISSSTSVGRSIPCVPTVSENGEYPS